MSTFEACITTAAHKLLWTCHGDDITWAKLDVPSCCSWKKSCISWYGNLSHHLRRFFCTSQVVVWDFWTINSMGKLLVFFLFAKVLSLSIIHGQKSIPHSPIVISLPPINKWRFFIASFGKPVSSWWFQLTWKIFFQIASFPQVGVKIKIFELPPSKRAKPVRFGISTPETTIKNPGTQNTRG